MNVLIKLINKFGDVIDERRLHDSPSGFDIKKEVLDVVGDVPHLQPGDRIEITAV